MSEPTPPKNNTNKNNVVWPKDYKQTARPDCPLLDAFKIITKRAMQDKVDLLAEEKFLK